MDFRLTSTSRLALLGFFSGSVALAATDIDLKRLTPVTADTQIPTADFFRPARFHSPKLNPSGTRFAALVETGTDNTGLMMCDLDKKSSRVVRGPGNKDIYMISWLNSERIIMSVSSDKLYAEGMFVAFADDLSRNYPVESHSATSLVAVPRKNPLQPLIWIQRNAYDEGADAGVVQIDATRNLNRNTGGMPGSFQYSNKDEGGDYNARASIMRTFSRPAGGVVVEYLEDKEGALAFAITADNGLFSLFRYINGEPAKCLVDLDQVFPVSHGDKHDELIVIGPRQEGKPRALLRLDATTGELGEVLCQDKAYDIDAVSVYRHPVTRGILGIKFSRSRLESVWFDESYRTVQKVIEDAFPQQVVSILGSNDEENRFFVGVYSDRQPVRYYTLETKTKRLELVESTAPWIDPSRMQPMNVVKWKSRDGFTLEGYLTLPAGTSKEKPAPLVVLPHGGPWVRDSWGFDAEVQFLANRGYAVLQPNYRGSPGYDWKFPAADQWAFRKMHDDVTDAVKTLLRTGLVDPQRVAIMGTSFGGYLAACGAAFEPGLYRCAIAISGVFDWERVIGDAKYDQYVSAQFGVLRRNLGNRKTREDDFTEISPLRHIDKVKVPMFVAHGRQDSVASIEESQALIAQLKKFGVPHETMLVSGEGHGMSKTDNQVRLYSRIDTFLAQNLAPIKR